MTHFLYGLTIIGTLIAGPLIVALSSVPQESDLVLVLAPDVQVRENMIREAGGRLVGPEQAVFGSFAVSDDPEFVTSLKASGAWFVVNGQRIALLCGVDT